MNRITTQPFYAHITFGLIKGYGNEIIDNAYALSRIQKYQDELIESKGIHLSASVSDCLIVCSGQIEPHLRLSFINYPKFPLPIQELKTEIENFARFIMIEFYQNRIVIEFHDETVMLEQSSEIDPQIKIK